ncbi:restriction endonuclease S subunit [Beggiatoa alba B18LD]|uniref:Restriction endonuclease S subunit n=1 Tax=Beggiatoa alba B18LD TaxID=395493 RepID=I3CCJ8_9GAMM|nr:restriction endonuclease subunit S [Beggiatoa alba]EIJ41341.1 restriction endonuclease S subunit [Beggiatoa alba B18LD]
MWDMVKLGDVCTLLTDGTHYTPPDLGYGIPFLTVKDVSDDGLDFYNCSKISIEEYQKADIGNSAPKLGDVLFSKDGTVGKVYVVKENIEFAVLSSLAILRPNKELDSSYLGYVLKSPIVILQASKNKTGSALRRIILNDIKKIKIPLPPLAEQKRIATILDKADAIRRKRQQAIKLADDFLRAVFLDMFGDPVTNPKGWEKLSIGELCTIVRGSSPRPKEDPRFYGGLVPRLMVADLTRDGKLVTPKIDYLTEEGAKKSRFVQAGTVVMAVSGNVGLTSILAIDACIHDGFIAFNKLNSNRVKPEFLQETLMLMKTTHVSRQAGAIFQNLTTTQIKEMKIPLPPIELQNKYLILVKKFTEIPIKLSVDELFNSLSQRAFSGKL